MVYIFVVFLTLALLILSTIDEFIHALRSGDQLAFRKLVETYQEKVLNTAVSMVQDAGMAEDIAQEVFVTVYKTMLSFKADSSLSTWIYRITVNKCLDHLRSKTRQKRAGFLTSLFQKEDGREVISAPDFVHPGTQLERREEARYLFKAIDQLQERQKTVFVLTYVEELPQKEVAEIMNMSVKGVESLLQRAKGNLRKFLGGVGSREG